MMFRRDGFVKIDHWDGLPLREDDGASGIEEGGGWYPGGGDGESYDRFSGRKWERFKVMERNR